MNPKIVSILIFSFVLFSTLSCDNSMEEIEMDEIETDNPAENEYDFNYLALGDSYTIGTGVSENDRWPAQLSRQIENDTALNINVDYIAQTGWTTSNLITAISSYEIDSGDYDLVSLLIGVNNQYQSKPFSIYETEFDSLLNIAVKFAGQNGDVFVVSIPDYGVTPFGSSNSETIAREIDEYNAYAAAICEERGIIFIDVTSISRDLGDASIALTSDNLHPSGYQYAIWTDRIKPRVLDLIKE